MSEVKEKSTKVTVESLGLDAAAKERIAQIKTVTVIGAGTMGNGITHVFAQYGCKVHMLDISREAIDKAIAKISGNMDRQIAKNLLSEEDKNNIVSRIKKDHSLSEYTGKLSLPI